MMREDDQVRDNGKEAIEVGAGFCLVIKLEGVRALGTPHFASLGVSREALSYCRSVYCQFSWQKHINIQKSQ